MPDVQRRRPESALPPAGVYRNSSDRGRRNSILNSSKVTVASKRYPNNSSNNKADPNRKSFLPRVRRTVVNVSYKLDIMCNEIMLSIASLRFY